MPDVERSRLAPGHGRRARDRRGVEDRPGARDRRAWPPVAETRSRALVEKKSARRASGRQNRGAEQVLTKIADVETDGHLLEAALRYAALGWRVHPLWEALEGGGCACGSPEDVGKHPRLNGWNKQATTSERTIRSWWAKWPTASVGIAGSEDLHILDIDPDKDGPATLLDRYGLDGETLALTTPSARTGSGGLHLFFRAPPGRSLKNS